MFALLFALTVINPPEVSLYVYVEDGDTIRKICYTSGKWTEHAVETEAPDWEAWTRKLPDKEAKRLLGHTVFYHFTRFYRYFHTRTFNGTNKDFVSIGIPSDLPIGTAWKYGPRKGKLARLKAGRTIRTIKVGG